MNAKKLIEQILQEMPIDPGQNPDFIHREKKQKFSQRSHPMAKNPAYPEFKPQAGQKETNWEEVIASKQYQDTMTRLKTFFERVHGQGAEVNFQSIYGAMAQGLQDAMAAERPYRRALEKLAVQLIFEQPEFASLREPYESGQFKIDIKLGVGGDNANIRLGDNEEEFATANPELENEAAEALNDITPEVLKRKVINAMIAGGAVSKNYAYQLYNDRFTKINPSLPSLYGLVMAGTELGYFAVGDESVRAAAQTPGAVAGSAEMETEGEVPTIKVRGMIFPVLIQELAKGLLELVSYEGLPQDDEAAKQVIDKADLADEEAWAMIMGRGLWMRFVNAIGMDETDVTMNLYNYLVQLPPKEFNATMKTIQAGGPEAEKLLKGLADQIRHDIESEKHGDYQDSQGEEGGEDSGGEYGLGGDSWKKG